MTPQAGNNNGPVEGVVHRAGQAAVAHRLSNFCWLDSGLKSASITNNGAKRYLFRLKK